MVLEVTVLHRERSKAELVPFGILCEHPSKRWCQGVRPAQIRKGATQAVVGGLMEGSGPKSVSGSSRMNSELGEYDNDARDFRLVQASGE
jgi:hypothetical protein